MWVGGMLGFVSGLTGIGGGIFLSPLLFLIGWTSVRGPIPLVAVFVLVNSISGLLGYVSTGSFIPGVAVVFVAAAIIGALIGSELAKSKLSGKGLRALLGIILVTAASKMFLTA